MVEGYEAGSSVYTLGSEFGIHRVTVAAILRRRGVPLRRAGLNSDQVEEAAHLYLELRWSLARIGEQMAVAARTVRSALLAHGVTMRDVHGRDVI